MLKNKLLKMSDVEFESTIRASWLWVFSGQGILNAPRALAVHFLDQWVRYNGGLLIAITITPSSPVFVFSLATLLIVLNIYLSIYWRPKFKPFENSG